MQAKSEHSALETQDPAPKMESASLRVLIVDDDAENLKLLQRLLRKSYRLLTASSGAAAIECLREFDCQVVLSDYRMPEMTGVDLLENAYGLQRDAVRILVTAFGDMEIAADAINRGHVDFLMRKPYSEEELRATLARAEEIFRLKLDNQQLVDNLKAKNQALVEKERQLALTLDTRGRELLETVRELERTNQRLSELVLRDGLTGLFNHRCFQTRLREEWFRARRYKHALSLIYIDVDHFKIYNELHGHPSGDQLLCAVARVLSAPGNARACDVISRYGGDEFIVILPETGREGALAYATRVQRSIERINIPGQEQLPGGKISLSIGIAVCPDDADTARGLLTECERALARAKTQGPSIIETRQPGETPAPASEPAAALSGIGPYRDRLHDLEAILTVDGCLSVLMINFSRLRSVEQSLGRPTYEDLRLQAEDLLREWVLEIFGDTARLLYSAFGDDTFLIFYGGEVVAGSEGELRSRAEILEERLMKGLADRIWSVAGESLFAAVGHARIVQDPSLGFSRQIESLMQEAMKMEEIRHYQRQLGMKDTVQKIILENAIRTLYQSILHLPSGEVVGYEALTRGPVGSSLATPDKLFHTSERLGLHHQLDRLCIRCAIHSGAGIDGHLNVFVNVLPSTLHDAALISEELPRRLEEVGISPAKLVLEVSEREAMRNPAHFQSAVERCHIAGIRVAIDDVGSRYANFDALLSGNPDFIKVDQLLIRAIDKSQVKQGMVRSLLAIGADMGAQVITEGVETEEELKILRELGVQYCQGWYFSKAEPPPWRNPKA